MKAAVVCANEDVQYLDYEEPTPGPGEVKVKVNVPVSADLIFHEYFITEFISIQSYLDMSSQEML